MSEADKKIEAEDKRIIYSVCPRELSRLLAILVTYNLKYHEQNKQKTINYLQTEDTWKSELPEDVNFPNHSKEFFLEIVNSVVDAEDKINYIIKSNITSKKIIFERLDKLIVSILQCGTSEILSKKLDRKIIISQYIFLTSCFYNKKEISMVNAILSSIANALNYSL